MMAISFKGAHFPKDIILMGVRWYVAYPLSYRHVERTHGGARRPGRPRDHPALGGEIQSLIGGSVSSPEAAGVDELAYGRDVH
jgi:hypothetical protein